MSYSFIAVGTKQETARTVRKMCDGNSSPEMPVVKEFLLDLLDSVEGDDKRVFLDASGWHSSGLAQHKIDFRTVSVPPAPDE